MSWLQECWAHCCPTTEEGEPDQPYQQLPESVPSTPQAQSQNGSARFFEFEGDDETDGSNSHRPVIVTSRSTSNSHHSGPRDKEQDQLNRIVEDMDRSTIDMSALDSFRPCLPANQLAERMRKYEALKTIKIQEKVGKPPHHSASACPLNQSKPQLPVSSKKMSFLFPRTGSSTSLSTGKFVEPGPKRLIADSGNRIGQWLIKDPFASPGFSYENAISMASGVAEACNAVRITVKDDLIVDF